MFPLASVMGNSPVLPILMVLVMAAGAYQVATGRRAGFGIGPGNPSLIRLGGAIGVLIGAAGLVYWLFTRSR